jgi:hypothetical protein
VSALASPYADLPDRAFWSRGVAQRDPSDLLALYTPKFGLTSLDFIATAGSCFAQHVGRTLRGAGFNLIDAETLPPLIDDATAQTYGYRLYSARYGNIYTARQMLQLVDEAFEPTELDHPVWQRDGRFFDAQRPTVEPLGLDSADDVLAARADHLERVRLVFGATDVFVFTFGLTEAWISRKSGTVYPTAPGTIAGTWNPELYGFHNFSFAQVLADFLGLRARLRAINPAMRFVVTVSPVPLTATASGQHVEVATARSKAVLRAVAAELAETCPDVDYFPSYEIITSQAARGRFFAENLRQVTPEGVGAAMSVFLAAHGVSVPPKAAPVAGYDAEAALDVVCEEALLEAFRA